MMTVEDCIRAWKERPSMERELAELRARNADLEHIAKVGHAECRRQMDIANALMQGPRQTKPANTIEGFRFIDAVLEHDALKADNAHLRAALHNTRELNAKLTHENERLHAALTDILRRKVATGVLVEWPAYMEEVRDIARRALEEGDDESK